MRTIELFSGTKSFSNVASSLGHNTLTVDNEVKLNPDIVLDIMHLDAVGGGLRHTVGFTAMHNILGCIHKPLLDRWKTKERKSITWHSDARKNYINYRRIKADALVYRKPKGNDA